MKNQTSQISDKVVQIVQVVDIALCGEGEAWDWPAVSEKNPCRGHKFLDALLSGEELLTNDPGEVEAGLNLLVSSFEASSVPEERAFGAKLRAML